LCECVENKKIELDFNYRDKGVCVNKHSMPNFQPLVSIVIPVYNGANYMREAIDSALAQTYQNIEIIVINDGSCDDGETEAIAQSYGDRIRYFRKDNGGCASALNLGIAEMRGEYFSWLSHDDRYLPEKVGHQIELLANMENKETIIYGGYEIINSESIPQYTVRPDSVLSAGQLDIPLLPLLRGLIHGCSLLIPAKYFSEVGVFDISLPSTQDYALWFDMFRVSPLHFDPKILIQSRVHPDQGTHKIDRHIDECNALWSGFLRKLTPEEMAAMEGSSYKFLVSTAKFLANTPYKEAHKLALKMAADCEAETKVSVIIPFYNRVAWAIEAIRSVLEQTHQNLEVILIDDGSTDDLTPLVEFVGSDSRIKYFRQENSGPAKARNNGVERATGSYIAFLDADDLFYPTKLEVQLNFMQEAGLAFSHTSYHRMDLEGNVIGSISSGTLTGNVFPGIMASCPIAMPTVMARAEVLKRNRFPEHFEIAEDVCLWITIASKYEIGGMDGVFSKVRVGPSTAALNKRKQAMGYINIAFFIVHDPHLAQYERQLKSLLLDAVDLFSHCESPLIDTVVASKPGRHPSVFRKVLSSLRHHGLRATQQRIFRRLGW
jgi:glycosyltransferase involved in cell wall biosynthesis